MSDQQAQQQIPIIHPQELSAEGKRVMAAFDELETKQLDTLDESAKGSIERIATFLGVLFAVTVLSNNFPPPYLKGLPAKIVVSVSLLCFLLSIGAGLLAIWIRRYQRYYNVQKNAKELQRMLRYKLFWNRAASILFALGAIALAVLLLIVVWSL